MQKRRWIMLLLIIGIFPFSTGFLERPVERTACFKNISGQTLFDASFFMLAESDVSIDKVNEKDKSIEFRWYQRQRSSSGLTILGSVIPGKIQIKEASQDALMKFWIQGSIVDWGATDKAVEMALDTLSKALKTDAVLVTDNNQVWDSPSQNIQPTSNPKVTEVKK